MMEKKLKEGEYDLAFFRSHGEVPAERIEEMTVGQRALINVETGIEDVDKQRLERYREKVETELVKRGINHRLETKSLKFDDGRKLGLIITRQ
ncbi:MAG: hypothetical protein AABX79_02965 [Nanoarchaeota archaeon]